ncbi:MAG TPA: hypothetical protein VFQ35_19595, partial [Polyangiaceae bacterium]|nr:hypothetical protein [Polyangiaceae bacterium]
MSKELSNVGPELARDGKGEIRGRQLGPVDRGRRHTRTNLALALLGLVVSCGMHTASDSSRSADNNGAEPTGGSFSGGLNPGAGGATVNVPPLPPEKEKESTFKLPVRSGRWVWSANPLSNRVAVIDTKDLGVRVASAGFGPTYLAPLPASATVDSAAIVLNARSSDASVMRLVDGTIDVKTVPTHVGANACSVSPSGNWAIAWSDAASVTSPDPADSYQDITLIDVSGAAPRATRLSVGYRPNRIFFDRSEAHAFVVSEASVSVIDLSRDAPNVSRDITLGTGREKPTDVAVVPQGTHALFRVEGSPNVSIVELESGARTNIVLSGPVTDLDLVADGASAIAVVRGRPANVGDASNASGGGSSGSANGSGGNVSRVELNGGAGGGAGEGQNPDALAGGASGGEAAGNGETDAGAGGVAGEGGQGTPPASGYGPSEVAILSVARVLESPMEFSRVQVPDVVGSVAVSSDGAESVLFTTAASFDRVTVLPTDPTSSAFLTPRSVYVHAPVDAVFIAPDHTHALVTLKATQGSSGFG